MFPGPVGFAEAPNGRAAGTRGPPLGDLLAGVARLLSNENDRQSPEEPGALPAGVRAGKGGEMEAGLPVGWKTLLFRFLRLTAAAASPPCPIPPAGASREVGADISGNVRGMPR